MEDVKGLIPLEEFAAKRRFEKTPEPPAGPKSQGPAAPRNAPDRERARSAGHHGVTNTRSPTKTKPAKPPPAPATTAGGACCSQPSRAPAPQSRSPTAHTPARAGGGPAAPKTPST